MSAEKLLEEILNQMLEIVKEINVKLATIENIMDRMYGADLKETEADPDAPGITPRPS